LDFKEILKEADPFKGLNDKEIQGIAELGTAKKYSKGDVVFEENSEGNEFFIVISGCIAINKNVAGERKRTLSTMKPGELFGELSLFDSQPRSAEAEAMEDAEVMFFPNDKFRKLLKSNLVMAFIIQTRIIRILCQRLRTADEMLKEGIIWGVALDD